MLSFWHLSATICCETQWSIIVGFPGAVVPGAKPRFILKSGQLTLVNLPLAPPEVIFSRRSIKDLPSIEYERWFKPRDWEWHKYHSSYLFRFAISWVPPWPAWRDDLFDEETESLGSELLRSFMHQTRSSGSIPIVVFLPEYTEFHDSDPFWYPSGRKFLGLRVLRRAGIEHTDMTPCLEEVHETDRFTTGWHYTPRANAAIADCLGNVVLTHLSTVNQHS